MKNLGKLSDKDIYKIAKRWGAEVLHARRKFAGLLPEIYRRELRERTAGRSWFQKRGFSCVYEFAAKLGGISREQVDEYIRIEKKCEDKLLLKEALVSGEVSINKLSRIMSIATIENQRDLLGKVQKLSKAALDVYVKDLKSEKMEGLHKPKNEQIGLYGQTENRDLAHVQAILKAGHSSLKLRVARPAFGCGAVAVKDYQQANLKLDEDILRQLLEMQNKGIDVNGFLRGVLKERVEKIEVEKEELSKMESQKAHDRVIIGYPASRHVSVKIKRILTREFGTKCSEPNCDKPASQLHHEKLFAKWGSHDPRYLKPLCRGHHELRHCLEKLEVREETGG